MYPSGRLSTCLLSGGIHGAPHMGFPGTGILKRERAMRVGRRSQYAAARSCSGVDEEELDLSADARANLGLTHTQILD
jgi:hypothetical protein